MEKRFNDLTIRMAALEAEIAQCKQEMSDTAQAAAKDTWRTSIEQRIAELSEKFDAMAAMINENKIL